MLESSASQHDLTRSGSQSPSIWILTWGALGVVALLAQAIWRLTPIALEPLLQGSLTAFQGAIYAAWVVSNAYMEGYRGFQKKFSPRVVARAVHLARKRHPWAFVLVAPLYCMSFFHSTRRGLIAAWAILGLVLVAIGIVRLMPQPWRGIVDGGVVVGLSWGTIAILVEVVRVLMGREPLASPELPHETESER